MRQTVETVIGHKTGTDELITVDAGAMVTEAVQIMAERHVGAVLIQNEDGLVDGIFTERAHPQVGQRGFNLDRHRHLLVIDGPRVHGLLSLRDLAYHLIQHGEGRLEAAIRASEPPAA